MAKNKKSKILAMTLCAGVMAGIYASPVMAMKYIDGSNYFVTNGTINTGTFIGGTYNGGTFNGELLFHGNANMENLLVDGVSVNAAAANGVYGDRLTVGGTTLDFVQVNQTISNTSGINKVNGKTTVDWGLQVVNPKNNRVGFNVDYNGNVTIGKNGSLVVGKAFRVTNQGSVSAKWLDVDKTLTINGGKTSFDANGSMSVAQGRFVVDRKGNITNVGTVDGVDVSKLSTAATDISDLQNRTQYITGASHDTTYFKGAIRSTGDISSGYGAVTLSGNYGKEAAVTLRDAGDKTYTLTATQLGNINNVILENGVVNGAAGSNIGGVRFSGGGDLNDVNHINGAEVQGWGDGGLEISGVAMENGAIKVNAINGATVNYYGEGGLEISGVGMLNGDVSAQTFNGVSIEKDTDGSAVIGGIDLGNLNENVTAVTENIAGIERIDKDGDGTKETTTIEGRLVVNKEELVIGGYGEGNSLTIKADGARFAGNVVFNNGYDVSFSYGENGSKGTSLGKLAEGFDNLNAKVDDIYDRTQGISRDEDGNTVISNDERTWNEETGTSEVTDNDGATITVGDDVNVDGGNLNVNNGDLNVGTSGEGGSGSGEGGSTGGNGGNGNFSSDINVGGNANVNGTVTVGDASDGKYTQVGESGMTIVGKDENNNTTTNNISDKGMTVTGENGTNNISDSGMTITGKDGNTTNNISDKGMTVTGSNGTTDISGGDISVDNSVTVAGGSENKTTINNEGITVGDKGTSIKNDSISVGDGGYIGDGDVRSGDGVSLNDTAERVGHLENRVGELEDRIDKVGAMAAAIANLRTMGYDPAAPTEVAVGIGQYRDETGAALGLFHYPNRDFMLSLSVSTSGDEVMGGIGATWKFGRKSPEKVAEIKKAQAEADARRAEEAKLAKAEEMKQAAKEAKIKAQQERHAKLAAERAAQAEAAK